MCGSISSVDFIQQIGHVLNSTCMIICMPEDNMACGDLQRALPVAFPMQDLCAQSTQAQAMQAHTLARIRTQLGTQKTAPCLKHALICLHTPFASSFEPNAQTL